LQKIGKDDESQNNIRTSELLNILSELSDIREEFKALQRSFALLRQDIPKILRNELVRLKGDD
jgi:hypothetical protein